MSPILSYPTDLPVSAARQEILKAIQSHQVVVISGATGSGKTTQLPKMCLEAGRGVKGLIGHTQPRRLAAKTVAQRIAAEMGESLGETVGYQVRFHQSVSAETRIKLMTDGILLAEIQHDPQLLNYDALIIDEAHERSLNIDFILGYLQRLVKQRPDLLVIITSATIDSARFAEAFGDDVPIIEVEGRTYPVEVRYRPLLQKVDVIDGNSGRGGAVATAKNKSQDDPIIYEEIDQVTGILQAVDELSATGAGDILVFLAGERDIRDTAAALQAHLGNRYVAPGQKSSAARAVEVLPLYSRLSGSEQHRIFSPHPYQRVVLATNVAETSLTVPGIKYVIDPGVARISRYSNKTRVQRLPIEAISQASANQRKGRCGRIAPGICIRLYSEEDFLARPLYTEPEIQRTSLSSVILQMASLGLGEIADFPFLDPPSPRSVTDGIQQLAQLGALDTRQKPPRLTRLGRKLARLPLDPRLSRILVEAQHLGVSSAVIVVVAALAMQDVRERPNEKRQEADRLHARFEDESSDFLSYLKLWDYLQEQQDLLSGSAFRRLCQREFLHYLRIREWIDLVTQLREMCRDIGIKIPEINRINIDQIDVTSLHRALISAMLNQIGTWSAQRREYEGIHSTHFTIWPGSGLAKKHYDWVMAAELVETSRLFARTVARIEPEWIEQAGKNLVTRSYFDSYWSTRFGAAMIHERVTLSGLCIVANRAHTLASLGNILVEGVAARVLARELFIRHALVRGEWREKPQFQTENSELLEKAAEARRRRQIPGEIDEYSLERWLQTRLPDSITSANAFNHWWKTQQQQHPHWLTYPWDLLVPNTLNATDFPDFWVQGDITVPLAYTFRGKRGQLSGSNTNTNPKKNRVKKAREVDVIDFPEGLTLLIPVKELEQISPNGLEWPVLGALPDRLTAWIKALPKPLRRRVVPATSLVEEILPQFQDFYDLEPPDRPPWEQVFSEALLTARQVELSLDDLHYTREHLDTTQINHFALISNSGKVMGLGDDFVSLRDKLIVKTTLEGKKTWQKQEAEKQKAAKPHDYAALLVNALELSETRIITRWRGSEAAALAASPYGSTAKLSQAAQHAAALDLFTEYEQINGTVKTRADFEQMQQWAKNRFEDRVYRVLQTVAKVVQLQGEIQRVLSQAENTTTSTIHREIAQEIISHVNKLVHPDFLKDTPSEYLDKLPRYLQADLIRWEKSRHNSASDTQLFSQYIEELQLWEQASKLTNNRPFDADSQQILTKAQWMLEEFRVSLFAQQLGTAQKVSAKRIRKILQPLL